MKNRKDVDIVKKIRCIVCPTGCLIEVKENKPDDLIFEGYTCKRGLDYAQQEYFEPKRILTTTIRVEGGIYPLIPIRTDKPLSKIKINKALKIIAETIVKAPIKMGDIIIEKIANEDVNVIASRDLLNIGE